MGSGVRAVWHRHGVAGGKRKKLARATVGGLDRMGYARKRGLIVRCILAQMFQQKPTRRTRRSADTARVLDSITLDTLV